MKAVMNHFTSKLGNQPQGFYTLLYTETCELFGQFGITALLVLYMTSILKTADTTAFACYGAFTAFIYAIPLLGGYFADRISGFKPALLIGIILMTAGNLCLVIPSMHMLYLGLAIFSVGSGFFTPTITAMVGRLYAQHEHQRDNAFILYYIAKNIGALFATLLCSYVATRFGYNYAFLISAIIMLSGYAAFSLGSNRLLPYFTDKVKPIILPKRKTPILIAVMISLIILTSVIMLNHLSNMLMIIVSTAAVLVILNLYRKFNSIDRGKLSLILAAVAMMMIFSIFLGEGGTTLNLFIERIIDRTVGSYTIPPSMFYALDPFFMIVLGTLVMAGLDKVKGQDQTIVGYFKIAIGLVVLSIGFLVFIAAASVMIHRAVQPSVGYVILAYAIFPVAELSIMPIVISLITRIAPRGYESFMIGLYMLGNAIASYLTGTFSSFGNVNFALNNTTGLIHAAKVYQHVFSLSALILFMSAVISCLIIVIYKNSKLRTNNEMVALETSTEI